MKRATLFLVPILLTACQEAPSNSADATPAKTVDTRDAGTPLGFEDAGPVPATLAVSEAFRVQVVLDRLGFSPGVIDGQSGPSLALALRGFQEANDLSPTGTLDDPTRKALTRWRDVAPMRAVRIPPAFAAGPFFPNLPKDAAAQAKLPAIGYRDLTEALAERFHTTPAVLAQLNRNGPITAQASLIVPNIADIDPATLGEDARGWNATLQKLAVSPKQPQAAKVVVDKSEGTLRAYDEGGKLIAQFPATMGSAHDPLPIGTWKIQGVSRNPDFRYNPKLFWDVSDSKASALLKPGPNNPVGVAWLDLSKPHYGIHGTGEPQTIGRAESHGCVRLTNWDVARLAQMVKVSTPAIFQN
ncbi:L,D-transpeptidase family protein [Sphingobium subterraneum]|uniref:Lipoprotein-anchoring transpeptidase ErfK/SrfK n=1 Tax=Sphingobium subterraneum TaxID=627688 RepID=A0A841IZV8_9SPHN|nr:murein L,D-transpeptidase [Sphingobium subterraneum]MBB6124203.1 lipoprotein-anchoring transpeptidase ErfK/SrfK [Sphingobium subterraneum]